jgi:acetyl-CoA carboxylase biotin carboxyl carrier protein
MDFQELRELMQLLEESNLTELEIEQEGRRVRLSKGAAYPPAMQYAMPPQGLAPAAAAPAAPVPAVEAVDEFAGLVIIESPMVGTFYAAHTPGEPPFVLPGDRVAKDQTVCIIEAMKIMNEVAAKHPGVLEKVLVENGQPVEFGQPLFAVRPL